MRKTLVVLSVALLGWVVYMVLGIGRDPAPVGSTPGEVGAVQEATDLQGPVAGESQPTPGEPARTELEGSEVLSAPGSSVRVRVTHGGTGAPVAGATVTYLEGTVSAVIAGLPQETQDEWGSRARDPEWIGKELGNTVVSDAEGMVLVPVKTRVTITGRHQELYGVVSVNRIPTRDPEKVIELELYRDTTLRVQILDVRGDPAPDVGFGLVSVFPESDLRNPTGVAILGTTGADGTSEIPHAQTRFRREWEDPQPVDLLLRPRVPGLTEGGVSIDPEDPPRGTVTLHLPPTGRVVVGVADSRGRPLPRLPFSLVILSIAPEEPIPPGVTYDPPSALEWGFPAARGPTATHERVVAGRAYHARVATRRGWVARVFMGPVEQDDEVRVDVPLDQEYFGLAGRILDGEGVPLADALVRVDYQSVDGPGGASFYTDPDGSFWVFLRPAERDTTLTSLSLEHRPGGSSPLAELVIEERRVLRLGDNDLGDIILRPVETRVLGRGRILVDGDVPEERSGTLSISAWHPPEGGAEEGRWQTDTTVRLDPEEGGRFRIQGSGEASRYRITHRDPFQPPLYLPVEPVEFAPGVEDLVIELETAGTLQAIVLTDSEVPVDDLWVRLVPTDGQVPEGHRRTRPSYWGSSRLYARATGSEEGRHRFGWGALWPGGYVLEVLPRGAAAPLVSLSGIRVERGSRGKLEEIDLRGRLREIAVTVTDPTGRPIERPMILIQKPAEGRDAQGYGSQNGTARILTARSYEDLTVAARGYLYREVPGVTADTTVILQPLREVTVKIAAPVPSLPEGFHLSVDIRRDRPSWRGFMVSSDVVRGPLASWFAGPVELRPGDEVGFPVEGEGRQHLVLSVENDRTGETFPIAGVEPADFDVPASATPLVIELRIPKEGLADALRRAGGR